MVVFVWTSLTLHNLIDITIGAGLFPFYFDPASRKSSCEALSASSLTLSVHSMGVSTISSFGTATCLGVKMLPAAAFLAGAFGTDALGTDARCRKLMTSRAVSQAEHGLWMSTTARLYLLELLMTFASAAFIALVMLMST